MPTIRSASRNACATFAKSKPRSEKQASLLASSHSNSMSLCRPMTYQCQCGATCGSAVAGRERHRRRGVKALVRLLRWRCDPKGDTAPSASKRLSMAGGTGPRSGRGGRCRGGVKCELLIGPNGRLLFVSHPAGAEFELFMGKEMEQSLEAPATDLTTVWPRRALSEIVIPCNPLILLVARGGLEPPTSGL